MLFKKINIWYLSSFSISLIVAIPILTVFSSFFDSTGNYSIILKKFEKASLVKLSKNIFSVLFEPFKIIAIVDNIINEVKLKIKLKLFLMKTPIIKIEKIDKVKKISGSKILKLFIILTYPAILNSNFIIVN